METKLIVGVVALAFVVAVVASMAMMSLTGNTVRVQSNPSGQNVYTTGEVYTRAQVDAKISGLDVNKKVLDFLDDCASVNSVMGWGDSCNDVCGFMTGQSRPFECVFGMAYYPVYARNTPIGCSQSFSYYKLSKISCMCCGIY